MMLLEYKGKLLLRSAGINVPEGIVVRRNGPAADRIAERVERYPVAVKVQVAGGGRGKQGGVVKAASSSDLAAAVRRLFSTSFGDERAGALLVEPWQEIERELYLSVTVDGAAEGYVVLFAPRGGMDVEEGVVPARYPVGVPWRFRAHELRAILEPVETDYQVRERVIGLAQRLVETAAAHDCTTVEINPLARLSTGELMALDAKIVYDEWAHFRNREIAEERSAARRRAHRLLRACLEMQHMYVKLDGDIGLISGGAGMTMAAMDLIRQYGGRPACFLDCSPGPSSTRGYRPAFAMLDVDPQVKVILVSIFGGGTQMQRVAKAMKENMQQRKSSKPVVFRLDGTNVDQVPGILETFGAKNHERLEDAVVEAVALAGKA